MVVDFAWMLVQLNSINFLTELMNIPVNLAVQIVKFALKQHALLAILSTIMILHHQLALLAMILVHDAADLLIQIALIVNQV